jgi:hypothetical protein
MHTTLKRRRVPAIVVAFAAVLSLVWSASASAWTRGNVWVNFPSSTNCLSGGKVVGIYWVVDGYSSGPAGGDWGDNVIYPSVRVGSGSYNRLSYEVMCKRWGWYTYRGKKSQRDLSPYKSGLSYTFY